MAFGDYIPCRCGGRCGCGIGHHAFNPAPVLADSRPAGHDPKRVVSVSVLDMPYIQALLAAYADLLAAVDQHATDYFDPAVTDAAAEVHRVIDQHTQEAT